jgi:putative transposase
MKRIIRKAFVFRLKADAQFDERATAFGDSTRKVWNHFLGLNLRRLENKQPIMYYSEMDFWSKLMKKSDEYHFFKTDAYAHNVQQKLKDLEKAFLDGFDKNQPNKRIPVFKKKYKEGAYSFRFPQHFKIDQKQSRFFLPKLGWVSYFNSREIIGTPKNITIKKSGTHWFASVQVEIEEEIPTHPSSSAIGIDVGIARFAAFSDGLYIEPKNYFRKLEEKLALEQRKLSRKVKFSANWKKQKTKINKIHKKIANSRKDFLHKKSTQISNSHAMIFVEDIKVKNLSKSVKGDLNNPGRNVKAKSGLNKSILDQGWSMFVDMLEYKQYFNGGDLLKVPPHHTSQTCPVCNHVSPENRQSQADFKCVSCSYEENADVVGAKNVFARGQRVLACQANDAVMSSATGTRNKSDLALPAAA